MVESCVCLDIDFFFFFFILWYYFCFVNVTSKQTKKPNVLDITFDFAHILSTIKPAATTVPLQGLRKPWQAHIRHWIHKKRHYYFLRQTSWAIGFFSFVINTTSFAEYLRGPWKTSSCYSNLLTGLSFGFVILTYLPMASRYHWKKYFR